MFDLTERGFVIIAGLGRSAAAAQATGASDAQVGSRSAETGLTLAHRVYQNAAGVEASRALP
jgi:hypothetical protein